MSKLSKAQAKAHGEACRLLDQDRLSNDERLFVIENWQESAKHINSIAGAFFTPSGLARDFSIEVPSGRVLDLCAGIGVLSLFVHWQNQFTNALNEIVCVEANPDYAAVGRKVLPEATWIVGDVFDLPDLGHFDVAISNPPFGATKRARSAPRYRGRAFELHVIDIASDRADYGVFIVPQATAPFRYSGVRSYSKHDEGGSHARFVETTGIRLEPNCGIDTSIYESDWHGVSIRTEIVLADFASARAARQPAQASFLDAAE